nr:carbamoyltransferase [Actinomycetota bacterium]
MLEPNWILGLCHGAHDSACALFRDGALVAFVEQERLSRVKHALGEAPVDAVEWCLGSQGLTLPDVRCVALGSDHFALAEWLGPDTGEAREAIALEDPARLFPPAVFGDGPTPPVVRFRHHLAHAASAFWPSGFPEAAILVLDAMGEDASAIAAVGSGDTIEVVRAWPVDVSLGYFYEAACEYVGFEWYDAGKLMGLAAYGRPTHAMPLVVRGSRLEWDGVATSSARGRALVRERREALLRRFEASSFPYERGLREEIMAYADFAASAQAALSEAIVELASDVRRETGIPRLAMAGGVALNCVANARIAAQGPFERVWVQPAAGDSGTALGAALH